MKGWGRFQSHYKRSSKAAKVRSSQRQIQLIQDYKDRVMELEMQNRAIAEENDKLRVGTVRSVKSIQVANDLQKQVESLSLGLAEKAATIRRLLEDNQRMSAVLKNDQLAHMMY